MSTTPDEPRRIAVFVLTHGRPDNVVTMRLLKRAGWTGATYLVIDDEDSTAEEYRRRYGERVLTFDKRAIAETFDTADLSEDRRTVVYARRACYDFARELGLTHFVELDDDYDHFIYRWVDEDHDVRHRNLRSMDRAVDLTFDFLDASGALCVAWSQGGDHFGISVMEAGLKRKAMNALFVRTERAVPWVGRLNEDVNAYVVGGSRGELYLTLMGLQLHQRPTQGTAGGMTDVYLDSGTYVKSFYTVMMAPSCVTIASMGEVERRFHHRVEWGHAVPQILHEQWRKA